MTTWPPAPPPPMTPFIAGLPKCELHLHIEGTLEPELRFDLAARNQVGLPFSSADEVKASYGFNSLTTFLVTYYDAMRVLLTEQDFYDLALAYLTKAASQNVRYVEMFFDPQAHTSRGVPFPTILGGLRRALVDAERTLGVRAALIMCFLRDFSAEYAMATLMEALPYKHWILAVGLDSDERGNPPEKFAAVYARARAEGFLLTMHCDVDQPGSIDNIRTALHDIGVQRIDHGSNVLEDDALVEELVQRKIGLTSCPVSNSWAAGGMKAQEIKQLLERGVLVTLNSDDPAYFNGYVGENYSALQEAVDLSDEQLVQLARNSFTVAWLPTQAREAYLSQITAYAPV
jgi:adenosine deaminase